MLGRVLGPEPLTAEGFVALEGRRKISPGRSDGLLCGLLNEGLDRSLVLEGALGLPGSVREGPMIRRSRSKSGRAPEGLPDDSEPLGPRSMARGRIPGDDEPGLLGTVRAGDDGRWITDGVERDVDGEDGRRMIDGLDREVDGKEGR
jgi:hypothetical protein